MSNPNNTKLKEISVAIVLFAGSSVLLINVLLKALCQFAGIAFKQHFQSMTFDWTKSSPKSLQSGYTENVQIDNEEHITASLNQYRSALPEAESRGELWMVGPEWHRNLGSVSDDQGAAANPKNGYLVAYFNRTHLKNKLKTLLLAVQDYIRTKILALGGKALQNIGRIPVIFQFNSLGAMGTGAMNWFILNGIPECAASMGCETKVILQLMLRGNLSPQDIEKSTLNERNTLKTLQVLASARYVDPLTGEICTPPFSLVQLFSNVNAHGNMTQLSQLMAHQAHLNFFTVCTPAGAVLRERACDIENLTYSDNGDPLCGASSSSSSITRNTPRIVQFATCKTIKSFCERLITPEQNQTSIDAAIAMAHSEKLVESEEDKGITPDLLRPKELGNQDVIQLAQDSLLQRTTGTRGLDKARRLEEAILNSLTNDIPCSYELAIKLQAQSRYDSAIQRIQSALHERMRTAGSLFEILQVFLCLRDILINSLKIIEGNLVELRQFAAPHHQILAEASAQLQQLHQKNKLLQAMSYLMIKRLTQDLKQSGLAAISGQLQILCCQTAIQTVLMPLIGYLDDKIAWLRGAVQKMADLSDFSRIKANNLAKDDTTHLNPNGFELTTESYLDQYYQEYVQKRGGSSAFSDQLNSLFLKQHGSFDIIIETAQEELFEMLEQLFSGQFESIVKATTVWDEMVRCFPEDIIKQMITTLILHSEGRVLAEDGSNHNVVWVKVGNIPSESCRQSISTLLESLDKKSGKWEIATHDDIDTFSICQYRGQISLTPFIERQGIPDNPEGWKAILEHAIDPVIALIIHPNPNPRQIQRVLVKAIAANLISVQNGCFYLDNPPSEPINLGRDVSSVMAAIRPLWRQMVYIESYFGHQLIINEPQILGRLDDITASAQSRNSQEDKRLSLIGIEAVMDCLSQVQIMLPWLRRMTKAALRETSL